mmetsp:Transcript_115075/g.330633  ORF Transcript_115075/g.330633 Transcript_115075/m.330633 type:complete len:200 (+) Transcript_115075:724-1323(+)
MRRSIPPERLQARRAPVPGESDVRPRPEPLGLARRRPGREAHHRRRRLAEPRPDAGAEHHARGFDEEGVAGHVHVLLPHAGHRHGQRPHPEHAHRVPEPGRQARGWQVWSRGPSGFLPRVALGAGWHAAPGKDPAVPGQGAGAAAGEAEEDAASAGGQAAGEAWGQEAQAHQGKVWPDGVQEACEQSKVWRRRGGEHLH